MADSRTDFRLPDRVGVRPRTDNAVPHLQKTQKSPPHLAPILLEWAVSDLPHVSEVDTRISVSATRALWLAEHLPPVHEDAFMPPAGSREFAHVHADGSLHLCVSGDAVREIVDRGWGEPHPLKDKGVNEVLFYAPRDSVELELAKYAIAEAWSYATGRPNPVQPPVD
jgi:phospholipase/carboxylesterase